MDITNPEIQKYLEEHSSPEGDLLNRLNRETHLHVSGPQMLSGHVQGRLLAMLSHIISPRQVLEIGTYTGYSALCMAEGLQEHGKLYTIDNNEELQGIINRYISEAGYEDRIEFLPGNARNVIERLEGPFDMVFIDADKENYSSYYNMVIEKTAVNGFILVDNVLWKGKVLQGEPDNKDKATRAIQEFNNMVRDDDRVEKVMLPVRDGITIIRKKV